MRRLLFLGILVCIFNTSYSQTTFSKSFSNFPLNPETIWEVIEIDDGYLISTVLNCLNNSLVLCGSLSKINKNGDIIWFKYFEFYPNTEKSLLVVNDKIYLCGTTSDLNQDNQLKLYCLSLEGEVLWEKEYGLNTKDEGGANIIITPNDEIFLLGERDRHINGIREWIPVLFKLNSSGEIIWVKSYWEENQYTIAKRLIQTTKNKLVFSYIFCPDMSCFAESQGGITEIDTDGNMIWNTKFPVSFQPVNCGIIQSDSTTLIAQWYVDTFSWDMDNSPPALFYMNLQGEVLDSFVFYNQSFKELYDIYPVWNKGLVGCGSNFLDSNVLEIPGAYLFRMNENKELLWERTYTDTSYWGFPFVFQEVIPTSDGGFIAVGTINNYQTGVLESHNWILKLDSLGCLSPNCADINYVLEATEEAEFLKGKNIVISPNPSNGWIKVAFPKEFSIYKEDFYINLYSSAGKYLTRKKVDAPEMMFDLGDKPSGTYFVVINVGNEIVVSKKVILVK
jgi:hypothetical protein